MNELSKIRKNGVDYGIKDSTAREAIKELKQNVAQDVIDALSKFDVEGDFVQIEPKSGSTINVVSEFSNHANNQGTWTDGRFRLNQAVSANLFDSVTAFGGAGKTVTKNGVTVTINEDGTFTIDGEWTGTAPEQILSASSTIRNMFFFPPGIYTVDKNIIYGAQDIVGDDYYGNRMGGSYMESATFRLASFSIMVSPGEVFHNEVRSLAFVRGTALPTNDHKYVGKTYVAQMTDAKALDTGVINWNTGEVFDVDGNLVETCTVTPSEIIAMDGTNYLYTGDGAVHATGEKAGISSSTSNSGAEEAFDPYVWGLPVLALKGNAGAMSKDVSVDLEYQYGMMSGTCSVKWQGSSSLAYAKKNYTVKFDNAFEAATGWGAQKKYCLKANYIDHSHSRNIVNAKLWGQIVKSRASVPAELADLVNGGAVDGFPVLLMLNDKFMGLYTFNIPKDAWMMGMGDGTSQCILCAGNACPTNYFRASATLEGEKDLEIEYITNEDDTAWAKTSVNNLINACINSNGSDLDTTIASMLDLQSAIDYYIFCVLIEGEDMVGKNYILATYNGTKWYFSAYDMDCTHGLYWDGTKWLQADNVPTFKYYATMHRLMELIKANKADAVKARYAELRRTVLSESNVATLFANFAGQIPKAVYMQEAKTWPMIPHTSTNDIAQIRDYYRMRVALADKWIEEI